MVRVQWAKHFATTINCIICPFVFEGYKSRSFSHFGAIFIECGLNSEKRLHSDTPCCRMAGKAGCSYDRQNSIDPTSRSEILLCNLIGNIIRKG